MELNQLKKIKLLTNEHAKDKKYLKARDHCHTV